MAYNAGIPAVGNQISSDIPKIEENFDYMLLGDGTESQVIRRSILKIEDGTNADTIKCTFTSEWNGDTIAAEDNIGKSGGTSYGLNANGNAITIEAAGLTGNAVAIISENIGYCDDDPMSNSNMFLMSATVTSNDIVVTFTQPDGSALDLTSTTATKYYEIYITYLTSS